MCCWRKIPEKAAEENRQCNEKRLRNCKMKLRREKDREMQYEFFWLRCKKRENGETKCVLQAHR